MLLSAAVKQLCLWANPKQKSWLSDLFSTSPVCENGWRCCLINRDRRTPTDYIRNGVLYVTEKWVLVGWQHWKLNWKYWNTEPDPHDSAPYRSRLLLHQNNDDTNYIYWAASTHQCIKGFNPTTFFLCDKFNMPLIITNVIISIKT